ncbi:MAG: flagellar biosynthesis anti-sigma factor FlgM [Gammaproteobacteria bacterium]|nr:flagellar biosynthesis anti-sigma factor FlgM [Gammaproteobacteria bacterium]
MANDITGINSSRSQQTSDRSVSSKKSDTSDTSSRSSDSKSSSGSDKVSLTDTAARLKALEQSLANQPEIDKERVSDVQNAINQGKYKVDAGRVADKMMNFEASFSKQD